MNIEIKIKSTIMLLLLCASVHAQEVYTLEKCKELALKNNMQAINSQLSVEAAERTKKEAFTNFFPSVSATGLGFKAGKPMMQMEMDMSGLFQAMGMPAIPPIPINMLENGLIGAVMATQPIFAGGQIINGNKLAKAGVEASSLQKKMTDNELLLNTEQYYWQIVSLMEKVKTIEDAQNMLDRIRKDVDMAVQAGLTTRNDLLRVELEQNRLASNKLKVENGLKLSKMVLGQCIGVALELFAIEKPSFDNLPLPADIRIGHEDALLRRAEYQLLNKGVEVSQFQLKMKQGENLPTVAVGLGYNYFNMDMRKESQMDNNFGMVFASVTIPISGWWGGSHAVKKQRIEVQKAENTRQQNGEMLLVQMQQIWNELEEAYQQLKIAEQSISLAEENMRHNTDYYNAGTSILSDLLDAQNLLQQSHDQYTDAATEYQIKISQYRQATGR